MLFISSHYQNLRDAFLKRPWYFALLFFCILLPFLAFGKIADEVHENETQNIDHAILHWIHQHATPHRDSLIAWATRTGGVLAIPAFLAVVAGFYFLKRRENAWFFAIAVSGAYLLDIVAKEIFQRVRPSLWLSPSPETNFSFPSGHAMVSMAIAMAFVFITWHSRWRWPVAVVAIGSSLLIGFSRLYLGVHYPTDVAGGWCAAIGWVSGLYLMLKRSNAEPVAVS
jgi:undecaprenyl-diphosphatase